MIRDLRSKKDIKDTWGFVTIAYDYTNIDTTNTFLYFPTRDREESEIIIAALGKKKPFFPKLVGPAFEMGEKGKHFILPLRKAKEKEKLLAWGDSK